MTTMLEKATDAAMKAIIGVEDVQSGEMREAIYAALLAIRHPTVNIHNAACESPHQSSPPRAELTEDGLVRVVGFKPANPSGLFTAMIDAILADKPEGGA